MARYNVLVVDDHSIFRLGVINGIKSLSVNFHFIEAADGKEAVDACTSKQVDVMLLDIGLPVMDGFAVITALKLRGCDTKIIVLTCYNEPVLIVNLLKLGVDGYVPKSVAKAQLLEAIDTVMHGGNYYPKELLNDPTVRQIDKSLAIQNVSAKEIEIMQFLSQGLTSKEIAEQTGYTKRYIETIKFRLGKKFNGTSSGTLISIAYKMGILKV